jgi:glyoxylase-like metal-dependent hydrolase (beta-lactamase superfamily II)
VHLPGHTPGHSGLLVEPDGFFYVADVDLSAFGPYYGDAVSSLVDTQRSLARCREVDARWYATFHHKGVLDGRPAFLAALDAYADVIDRREAALLEFLAEPRTLTDVVDHRFVYRRHVDLPFADSVERHTARRHLERMLAEGRVAEVETGRYRASA